MGEQQNVHNPKVTKKGPVLFPQFIGVLMTGSELFVYFLAFIPVAFYAKGFLSASYLIWQSAWLLAAFFSFQLTLIFASALLARCFPYPKAGRYQLHDQKLHSLWVRENLSTVCYRSFVHGLANFFPFPGYFYYRLLGAKIHPSSFLHYTAKLMNPYMITIGEHCDIGTDVFITGHISSSIDAIELGPIKIGNCVLVGANSSIWCNTVIGDNSVIAAHSFVAPGTVIPSGEVWGGVPAKFIKKLNAKKDTELPEEIRQAISKSSEPLSPKKNTNPLSSSNAFIGDPNIINKEREMGPRRKHSGATEKSNESEVNHD